MAIFTRNLPVEYPALKSMELFLRKMVLFLLIIHHTSLSPLQQIILLELTRQKNKPGATNLRNPRSAGHAPPNMAEHAPPLQKKY